MGDDRRSMRDRMLAGELYIADESVADDHRRAMDLLEEINRSPAADPGLRRELFTKLLGAYGEDVQIGPHVELLTATHPLDPDPRREKWESAESIVIEANVWLGGGVIVCPGVTVGKNTVVGAGAVVTRGLPPDVLAVGSPAKPIRAIGG